CRSPMAEAVFKKQMKEAGLAEHVLIDSAGTAGWHEGSAPHEGTIAKLDEAGIPTDYLTARQLRIEDAMQYEIIIAMDDSKSKDVRDMFSVAYKTTYLKHLM